MSNLSSKKNSNYYNPYFRNQRIDLEIGLLLILQFFVPFACQNVKRLWHHEFLVHMVLQYPDLILSTSQNSYTNHGA